MCSLVMKRGEPPEYCDVEGCRDGEKDGLGQNSTVATYAFDDEPTLTSEGGNQHGDVGVQ